MVNAAELKQTVLDILRSNRVTKDVEVLTQFQANGFTFDESQDQLLKAKAYFAAMNGQNGQQPVQPEPQPAVVDAVSAQGEAGAVTQAFVDSLPHVPAAMKAVRQWVRWKLEPGSNGRMTKVPYRVDGRKASSTNPDDWTDYETAVTGVEINSNGGVGFVFSNGFMGIDLDGCRDPQTGEIKPWADEIAQALDKAYVEVSPSGNGLHIFVLGKVPGNDKKFNLNPAIGYGEKVAIEFYDTARYFTVTGELQFEDAGDVVPRDLTEAYEKARALREANPAPRDVRAAAADSSDGTTKIEKLGDFNTTKYDIFTSGVIESTGDHKPFIISDGYGRLTYPGFSEADQSFMNVSAYLHDGDADAMWDDYVNSPLARDKWLKREADFRRNTIAKAIQWVKEIKPPAGQIQISQTTLASAGTTAPTAPVALPLVQIVAPTIEDEKIPPFDRSIITGFYKNVVDAVCDGTTIPPQFVFQAIRTYTGTYMSPTLRLSDIEGDTCRYFVAFGETGTSKGLSWRRSAQGLFIPDEDTAKTDDRFKNLKMLLAVDSGAGLRDAFFIHKKPILLFIDEMSSLGNKANPTKNPEIADMIIELADTKEVGRGKAQNGRKGGTKSTVARLGFYGCAQDGDVFRVALAGRKKQGVDERFNFDFSEPILPGSLPAIPVQVVAALQKEFVQLKDPNNWKKPITMTPAAIGLVDEFWSGLTVETQRKVRIRKNIIRDIYLQAWSRGVDVADVEDVQCILRETARLLVVRRVALGDDVPNRVGLYISRLKKIEAAMRDLCNAGTPVREVLKSVRDFQTDTLAYKENDLDTFRKAWDSYARAHLFPRKIKAANGQTYVKLAPIPLEHEVWDWAGTEDAEWRDL